MLADRLTGHRQVRAQRAKALPVAGVQRIEQLAAAGVGEGLEDVIHRQDPEKGSSVAAFLSYAANRLPVNGSGENAHRPPLARGAVGDESRDGLLATLEARALEHLLVLLLAHALAALLDQRSHGCAHGSGAFRAVEIARASTVTAPLGTWRVVQLAERLTLDQEVPGSSPGPPARNFNYTVATTSAYSLGTRSPRSLVLCSRANMSRSCSRPFCAAASSAPNAFSVGP